IRPGRVMIVAAIGWFACNLAFSWIESPLWGEAVLFVGGIIQSLCMVPMAVLLLRSADPAFRGLVMGVRMLAVYGMAIGLLVSGPLVEHTGFSFTGTLYSVVGIVFTLLIAYHWRAHLWDPRSEANTR